LLATLFAATVGVGVSAAAGTSRAHASRLGVAAEGSRILFAATELPRWDGEIYRVTPSGTRVDLSRSPAPDVAPAVSPDGRWVAFLSGRGGEWAAYVVGVDGRGLHRISSALLPFVPSVDTQPQVAWAANSSDLAVEVTGQSSTALYVGQRTGMLHRVANDAALQFAWSPDSRLLAYTNNIASVVVTNTTGKRLWSVAGTLNLNPWSANDRLVVIANSDTVAVYERSGRRVARFTGEYPAWSPGGTLLASFSTYALQLRRDGVGTPTLRWPAHPGPLQWVSATKLRLFGANGWVGFDVAHGRPWPLGPLAADFNSAVSTSGRILAEQQSANGSQLLLSTVGSTVTAPIASGPWCPDNEDFNGLAFLPHGEGVIYQTSCITPSADLYSINPDGSDLRQITNTPTDEMEPSISPDGQSIVYAQQLVAGKCDGCAQTLWRISINGGTPEQLTKHTDQDAAPFDQNPTWSPDGSEIAFQSSGAVIQSHLMEIPATGGAPRNLNVKGTVLPAWGRQLIAYADWSVPHLAVRTFDPTTGAIQTVASGGNTDVEALAWSRSGRLAYLYYDQRNNHALVAIVGSKSKRLNLSAHLPARSRVAGLAWSPDGTRFAFAATDGNGIGEIYTIATDGTGLRQLTKNIGALWNVGYQSTISWR
jgi:Tol biopolymer transport system component